MVLGLLSFSVSVIDSMVFLIILNIICLVESLGLISSIELCLDVFIEASSYIRYC